MDWAACWRWCLKPRPLTATEMLVAASFNTAVRRIKSGEAEDAVDASPSSPSERGSLCQTSRISYQSSRSTSGEAWSSRQSSTESEQQVALVRPIQRAPALGEASLKGSSLRGTSVEEEGGEDCESSRGLEDDACAKAGANWRASVGGSGYLSEGGPGAPLTECYGCLTATTRRLSPRQIGVLISQLDGVPWFGAHRGLTLELRPLGAAKSQWVFLPNATGSEVVVQREVNLKIPREGEGGGRSSRHEAPGESVAVTLWPGVGDHYRCQPVGHAVLTGPHDDPGPRVFPFTAQTRSHGELGSLELCLSSSATSSSGSTRNRGVFLKVLRVRGLRKPAVGWMAKHAARSMRDKERTDVWCSVTLWLAGEKSKKHVTQKMPLTASGDLDFNSSFTFFVPKQDQPNASIVVKVLCGRRVHEAVAGRVVLGPFLYLGSWRHPPLLAPASGCLRPVLLSHWGRSLTTHHPVNVWHRLTL